MQHRRHIEPLYRQSIEGSAEGWIEWVRGHARTIGSAGVVVNADELLERFEFFDDWEERYSYLIDLGRKLNAMPDHLKTEENLVRGCISRVWLVVKEDGPPGALHFVADSDSVIVKGLIAIVLMLMSGRSPQDILDTDLSELFSRLGLDGRLTANRRNGFYSMIGRIHTLAAAAA